MELSQTIAELAGAALAAELRIAPSGWRIAAWESTADFQMNQQESHDFKLELQPMNIGLRVRRGQIRNENATLRVVVETRASE